MKPDLHPLRTLSVIEFTGHDAGQFLHNQLSSDIEGLNPGEAGFACVCNPQGRVLGLLLVLVCEESILVVCARDLADSLQGWLSRYVLRADVKIELRSDLLVMAIDGKEESPAGWVADTGIGLKYAIAASSEPDDGENEARAMAWKINELKNGVCWLGPDSSAQFLPQMLGFESIGALSFSKGCYPGQEIIARTRYLGKLKRRPVLLHIAETCEVEIMQKINLHDGDVTFSGVIVDWARNEDTGTLMFTVARAGQDAGISSVTLGERTFALEDA